MRKKIHFSLFLMKCQVPVASLRHLKLHAHFVIDIRVESMSTGFFFSTFVQLSGSLGGVQYVIPK